MGGNSVLVDPPGMALCLPLCVWPGGSGRGALCGPMGPGKSVMPGDLYVVVVDKQVCGVRGGTRGTGTQPCLNIQWPVMGVNELL